MNVDSLVRAADVVAELATVGTLLFVASELRARRRQDRLTMPTTLDRSWNEMTPQMAASAKIALVFQRAFQKPEKLNESEYAQFRSAAGFCAALSGSYFG